MKIPVNKRYCTVKELSGHMGVPEGTLYEWACLRVIPSIKIGRRVLFDLKDIETHMEKKKRLANPKKRSRKILESSADCDTFPSAENKRQNQATERRK